MMVKTSNIYLAELRYYDKSRHSSIAFPEEAYALLEKNDNGYTNLLNNDINLPVYKRAHREMESLDSNGNYIAYRTYIILDSGVEEDGFCYIVEGRSLSDAFSKENVDYDDIKEFVLKSSLFFYDSIDILKDSIFYQDKAIKMQEKKDEFDQMISDYYGEKMVKVK